MKPGQTTERTTQEPHQDERETSVKTIDRAGRLLRILASGSHEGIPLTDISRLAFFGKATTHRLLSALIDAGLVCQEASTRRYRLGNGLVALARAALQQDIGALAKSFVRRIASITEDTAYASVPEGTASVCIAREIGSFPIRTLSLDVGDRRPLGVGSGSLAILAFLPDIEIQSIIGRNEAWLRDYKSYDRNYLNAAVAEARRYGFSFVDGRILPGMNAMGVPVFDAAGRPIASLSLSAIASRVSNERVSELAAILKKEATELGRALQQTNDGSAIRTAPEIER